MYLVLQIIGAILLFGGIIADVLLMVSCTNKTKLKFNISMKLNAIITSVLILFSTLGAEMLFIASIFGDEITPSTISGGNWAMMIIGTFLFISLLMFFVNSTIVKIYKEDLDKKYEKIVHYTRIGVGFAAIFAFVLMMEGYAPYMTYALANGIGFGGEHGIDLCYPNKKFGDCNSSFSIAFYAIFILSGAIFVYLLCDQKLYKIYGKRGMLESTFLIAFPAGIIGARIWYVILDVSAGGTSFTGANWVNIFKIWEGGLGIMGGATLGIIAGVLWVIFMKREIKLRQAIDIIVPTILLAQAIGRWGNFFNLEVFGQDLIAINDAWWMPSFVKYNMAACTNVYPPAGMTPDLYVVKPWLGQMPDKIYLPFFFIEFLTNIAGYIFITKLFTDRKLFIGIKWMVAKINPNTKPETLYKIEHAFPQGGSAGLYLTWYGITRAVMEPLRHSKDEFNTSIITSYVLIFGGLAVIALFAIYQYLIEPKHPFMPNRLIPVKLDENSKIAAEPSLNEEVSGELNEEIEQNKEVKQVKKKENKHSSINDDL